MNRLVVFTVFISLCFSVEAQVFPQTNQEFQSVFAEYQKNNYQENLVLTTNGNFFVSGETLHFSAFCVDVASFQLVGLSRLAYITLLNESKEPVRRTKIGLVGGRGNGELFLASSLPSGNYYLVAHTSIQRNSEAFDVFSKEITLINPFSPVLVNEQSIGNDEFKLIPEGGISFKGIKNKYIYSVPSSMKLPATGRIMDKDNSVLHSFEIITEAGHFSYTPSKGSEKLLITDAAGSISFEQLPTVQEGTGVSVEEDDAHYKVVIQSSDRVVSDKLIIVVKSKGQVANYESVALQGSAQASFDKKELPYGLLEFSVFTSSNSLIAERLVFNNSDQSDLLVSMNKTSFGKREKGTIELKGSTAGSYSIVVRKKDQFSIGELAIDMALLQQSPIHYVFNSDITHDINLSLKTATKKAHRTIDILSQMPISDKYLADTHGDLLTGKLTGDDVADKEINISEVGSNFNLLVAKTDSIGRFSTTVPHSVRSPKLYLQVKNKSTQIDIDDGQIDNYDFLRTSPLGIDSVLLPIIENKSLHSQIENAFYSVKTYPKEIFINPIFYGEPHKVYALSDYTRFSSMEETLREVTTSITVKNRKDQYSLSILDPQLQMSSEGPLVLMDGLPISNINDLINYDALEVDRIEIVRKKYYYGPKVYYGIISFFTREGTLRKFKKASDVQEIEYIQVQAKKRLYQPNYEKSALERIPDFRTCLFWEPMLSVIDDRPTVVTFFTSDVIGDYEVFVEGFNAEGDAVSQVISFIVQ